MGLGSHRMAAAGLRVNDSRVLPSLHVAIVRVKRLNHLGSFHVVDDLHMAVLPKCDYLGTKQPKTFGLDWSADAINFCASWSEYQNTANSIRWVALHCCFVLTAFCMVWYTVYGTTE